MNFTRSHHVAMDLVEDRIKLAVTIVGDVCSHVNHLKVLLYINADNTKACIFYLIAYSKNILQYRSSNVD